MNSVNLYSFIAALFCQYIGVLWHWWNMRRSKRTSVGFFTYVLYGTKTGQGAKLFAIFGTTWFSCTTGAADLINPELLWSMIQSQHSIHIASVNAILFAITTGYAADSAGNSIK